MLPLLEADAVNVIDWVQENIDQGSLAFDGIEREPHVTVLYGFDAGLDPEAVCDGLSKFGEKVAFRLGKISRFEQEDKDVIKVDVTGTNLLKLHGFLCSMFEDSIELTHPEFHPHLTLAYVQKGACRDLDGNSHFEGMVFVFDHAVYSTPGSSGRYIAFLDPEDLG